MKRKIAAIFSTIALAVTTTGMLTPAAHAATGTITVNIGTASCQYKASRSGGTVTANQSSCGRVGAKVDYKTAAGGNGSTGWIIKPSSAVANTPSGTSYFKGFTLGAIDIAGVWYGDENQV